MIPLMREAVRNWQPDVAPEEVGSVLTVGDEIATVSGLEHAAYGEILQFSSGVKGHGAGSAAGPCRLHPVRRQ